MDEEKGGVHRIGLPRCRLLAATSFIEFPIRLNESTRTSGFFRGSSVHNNTQRATRLRSLGSHSWTMMLVRELRDKSERQYKSRKRDNPHRLLYATMDQIRKTIPDGLPTGV